MSIQVTSPATNLEIQQMLRWFRQFVRGQGGEVNTPSQRRQRHVRWAQTATTAAVPIYPTSGNALPVKLGEFKFDDTASGEQTPTFTLYDPPDERIAYFTDGPVHAGVITRIELHNGMWFAEHDKGVVIALTPGGGIPAMSGGLCGSADCTLYTIDDSDNLVSMAVTKAVKNTFGTAIGGGVYIHVGIEVSGRYVVMSEDCS